MTELTDLDQSASTVVREFLNALEIQAADEASELLTDDIAWLNNSLPVVRGAKRVRQVFDLAAKTRVGFAVQIHHIASSDNVVLTERTDILRFGPVRVAFWVCGTFELRDGKIAVWHDYFSYSNFARGIAVGLFQAVVPSKRLASADL